MLAIFGALLFALPCSVAIGDASYARVDLRGQLVASDQREGLAGYAVRVDDMAFELAFANPGKNSPRLREHVGKTVLVTGKLQKHRGGGGNLLDVCVIEDTGFVVPGSHYLVGYTNGEAASALARAQSLKVVDDYRPGKYLVIEVTPEAEASFVKQLKDSPAVKYVELDTSRRAEQQAGD